MERLIKLSAALMAAFVVSGCHTVPVVVPPSQQPKPVLNPKLLEACPTHLSVLPEQPSFDDTLKAHAQDVAVYDNCRCLHEAARTIICSIYNIKCVEPEVACKTELK